MTLYMYRVKLCVNNGSNVTVHNKTSITSSFLFRIQKTICYVMCVMYADLTSSDTISCVVSGCMCTCMKNHFYSADICL